MFQCTKYALDWDYYTSKMLCITKNLISPWIRQNKLQKVKNRTHTNKTQDYETLWIFDRGTGIIPKNFKTTTIIPISLQKCKHLHVCRKHVCKNIGFKFDCTKRSYTCIVEFRCHQPTANNQGYKRELEKISSIQTCKQWRSTEWSFLSIASESYIKLAINENGMEWR